MIRKISVTSCMTSILGRALPAVLLLAAALPASTACAQDNDAAATRDAAIEDHIAAIENSGMVSLDELVTEFEGQRFSDAFKQHRSEEERRSLLGRMQEAAAQAGGVGVGLTDEGIVVELSGETSYEVVFATEAEAPYGITSLEVERLVDPVTLTPENLEAQLDEWAERGLTGVLSVKIDGEIILERAYGMANEALGVPNRLDTAFGIGSRPIEFTRAAIFLLEQQGRLDRDDAIGKHFEDVPSDKAGITLDHLMSGQSGLPDFPAQPGDWDADLAWIDRAEFERRTMAEPLLFEPGTDDMHSHWAFGLLAAVVERVSGQAYQEFLRTHFFDPAGMARTGDFGETLGLSIGDFAVGGGPDFIGLPNIPPNWGPTSWLVLGSGGMVSTLGDLQRFYRYVRSGDVLEPRFAEDFIGGDAGVDGSRRGFELFSARDEAATDEVFFFTNSGLGAFGDEPFAFGRLTRSLERLVEDY